MIAARLAEELGAVVLNKDTVRAALFPLPVLDYSAEQDQHGGHLPRRRVHSQSLSATSRRPRWPHLPAWQTG
jgi:predicted kinase